MKNIKLSHILGGYGVLALSLCSATYAAVNLNEYFPNASSKLQSLANGWASPINGSSKDINTPEGCRKITSTSGLSYHIPTNTSNEWASFRDNRPSGINISNCIVSTASVATIISGAPVNFGTGAKNSPMPNRVITIRNDGGANMSISGLSGLPGPTSIITNTCINISPSNTCQITLGMNPSNVTLFSQNVTTQGATTNASFNISGQMVPLPLFTNGSFNGALCTGFGCTPWGWVNYTRPGTILASSVDTINATNNTKNSVTNVSSSFLVNPIGPSPDGGTFVGIGRNSYNYFVEALEQTVSGFMPGVTYRLRFYSGNFGIPAFGYTSTNGILVLKDGVGVANGTNIAPGATWTLDTVTFTATATSHKIGFQLMNPQKSYISLDGPTFY